MALGKKKFKSFLREKKNQKPPTNSTQNKTKKEQPSNIWYAVLIKVEVSFMYALHSRLDTVVAVAEIWVRC